MTTGRHAGVRKSDATTPADAYDIGGGRINIERTARVGLVLHETRANFEAGNAGANLANLNLASFANQNCNGTCSWTRTVRSTRGTATNWSVSANALTAGLVVSVTPSINVAAGGTATFSVTADTSGIPVGSHAFFEVVFTDDSGQSPQQTMAGAVQRPAPMQQGTYVVATNATDASCGIPFAAQAGFGGWADFAAFGFAPQAAISGDTVGFTWTPPQGPIFHHGGFFSGGVHFRDDGFYFFPHQGQVNPGSPWINQPIPSSLQPNNFVAPLWHDWQFIFNAAQNRGATILNATVAGAPVFIHDYRRMAQFGSTAVAASFQVMQRYTPSLTPGVWDIVFAYNHLDGSHLNNTTVGVENLFGDQGVQFAHNDANLGHIINGRAICFRWVPAD
jgi:hypothetical protein